MQENLKFPSLTIYRRMLKNVGDIDIFQAIEKIIGELIKEDRFKWKANKKALLKLREKVIQMKELL